MIFNRFEECLNDFRKCQQLNSQDETSASAFHVAHIEYRLHVNQNPMDQHRALQLLEERLAQIKSPEGFLLLAQVQCPSGDPLANRGHSARSDRRT